MSYCHYEGAGGCHQPGAFSFTLRTAKGVEYGKGCCEGHVAAMRRETADHGETLLAVTRLDTGEDVTTKLLEQGR